MTTRPWFIVTVVQTAVIVVLAAKLSLPPSAPRLSADDTQAALQFCGMSNSQPAHVRVLPKGGAIEILCKDGTRGKKWNGQPLVKPL